MDKYEAITNINQAKIIEKINKYDRKCWLVALHGDEKASVIAKANEFEQIDYYVAEFRDGSHQFCIDLAADKICKMDGAVLYYSFKPPFDADVANVLRLLAYLKERFAEVVLLVPFMPFLREHVDGSHTDSLSLFDHVKILTLDAHVARSNVISFAPDEFGKYIDKDDLIIFPDEGATRYVGMYENECIFTNKDKGRESVIFDYPEKIYGRNCVILDDIVDTGYTLRSTIAELKKYRAKTIKACVTHYLMENAHHKCPCFFKWGLDFLCIYDTVLADKKIDCAHVLDFSAAFSKIKEKV